VAEAGRRLGISKRSVRMQAENGSLRARRVRTPHGVEWEIYVGGLPGPPATRRAALPAPPDSAGESWADLVNLVARMQDSLVALAQENGRLRAELDGLRASRPWLAEPFGEQGRVG
jgi:hypothetical protein